MYPSPNPNPHPNRFDFPKQKHTVVAVQGTDPSDLRDLIVDLRLWAVSALTDLSEKLIPLMNSIPTRNRAKIQWYIDLIQNANHSPGHNTNHNPNNYNPNRYIDFIQNQFVLNEEKVRATLCVCG